MLFVIISKTAINATTNVIQNNNNIFPKACTSLLGGERYDNRDAFSSSEGGRRNRREGRLHARRTPRAGESYGEWNNDNGLSFNIAHRRKQKKILAHFPLGTFPYGDSKFFLFNFYNCAALVKIKKTATPFRNARTSSQWRRRVCKNRGYGRRDGD